MNNNNNLMFYRLGQEFNFPQSTMTIYQNP